MVHPVQGEGDRPLKDIDRLVIRPVPVEPWTRPQGRKHALHDGKARAGAVLNLDIDSGAKGSATAGRDDIACRHVPPREGLTGHSYLA